jgi:hypothetical protein
LGATCDNQQTGCNGARIVKFKLILTVAFAFVVLRPVTAPASTFIVDTGTPPAPSLNTPLPVLDGSNWYAVEFQATAGETITQLSAYLTQGAGQAGDTFTWDIYSASGAFLVRSSQRETPLFSATGTFSTNGWNSSVVNWTLPTTGDYWLALEVSGPTQTRGLDLVPEPSISSGTVPALAFAYAGEAHQFAVETSTGIGIEISAAPLPAALPLFASGLGALGLLGWRRKRCVAA